MHLLDGGIAAVEVFPDAFGIKETDILEVGNPLLHALKQLQQGPFTGLAGVELQKFLKIAWLSRLLHSFLFPSTGEFHNSLSHNPRLATLIHCYSSRLL